VLIRGVGSKWTVSVSPSPGSRRASGMLDTATQADGMLTWKVKVALRSGWSKQANTPCAAAGSNEVNR
jgi:hypothetical protein